MAKPFFALRSMPAGRPWEACRVDCPRIFQTRLMWRKRIACRRSAGCTIPNTYASGLTTRLFGAWKFFRTLPETRNAPPKCAADRRTIEGQMTRRTPQPSKHDDPHPSLLRRMAGGVEGRHPYTARLKAGLAVNLELVLPYWGSLQKTESTAR